MASAGNLDSFSVHMRDWSVANSAEECPCRKEPTVFHRSGADKGQFRTIGGERSGLGCTAVAGRAPDTPRRALRRRRHVVRAHAPHQYVILGFWETVPVPYSLRSLSSEAVPVIHAMPALMTPVPELVYPLASSAIAGAVTSAVLHKWPVRGDQGLALAAITFSLVYLVTRILYPTPSEALCATIVLYFTYLTTLTAGTVGYRVSYWHPLASYPGPWLAKTTGLYGPFVRIGPNILSVNSPSATSIYLHAEKSDTYRRRLCDDGVELFLKPNISKMHRERKRTWAGLFTASSLSQLMPILERRTSQLMHCIERRQSQSGVGYVDLREALSHWGLDFTADAVFGGCKDFEFMTNGDPHGLLRVGKFAFAMTDVLGSSPWIMDILWSLPTPTRANWSMSLIEQAIHGVMKGASEFHGLLSYLLSAGVPERDIFRDAVVALQGGSDNISVILTLSVYYLLYNPLYYHRLRRELDEAFPDPLASLPADTLAALPFLNGTINEALRLGTPFFLPRVAPADGLIVDGRYIPGGTVVALAAYSQQISPDNFFPDPMARSSCAHIKGFHPERWTSKGLGPHTKTQASVLASFTYGPYACIGKPLAYREMRHALARLVLTFDMALPHDFDAAAFDRGLLNMHTTFLTVPLLVKVARRPSVKLEALPEP
ncbi:hypothetical protein ONZ51_g4587 [Trametes cubensis]|uniref:Cytochrome P450 n=1 Tax=Trametes cubensis TaxID=1111947 RepID=A0AAD7TVK9_9APHY|nr:hypothetical protein ONZ51_g4587 [Trametes cubensis]